MYIGGQFKLKVQVLNQEIAKDKMLGITLTLY